MLKKIFIISLIIFVGGFSVWGVYNISFKKSIDSEETEDTKNTEKLSKTIAAITSEEILAPKLVEDKNVIRYYLKNSGQVYEIDLAGFKTNPFSENKVSNFIFAVWSPNGNKTITKHSVFNETKFVYNDHLKKESATLKNNIDYVVWQNDNKIVYKYFNPETKERSINISNPDGSDWKKLVNLSFKKIDIAPIPQSGLISFWNIPDAYTETRLSTVSPIGEEEKNIFQDKYGADYLWSPDGNWLLVSHSNQEGGNKIQLAILDSQGKNYKNIGLPTLVSKCAWSKNSQTVFCALPGDLPQNVVMPNDYQKKMFQTKDTFWKVNIKTGEKERIINLEEINQEFDAQDLFLNQDESQLFFVNRRDGLLYRLSL